MAFWFPVWIPRTPLGWAAALLVGSVVLVVGYLAVGPDVNLPQNRNQFLIFVVIALSGGSWVGSRIERLVVERQRERVATWLLRRLGALTSGEWQTLVAAHAEAGRAGPAPFDDLSVRSAAVGVRAFDATHEASMIAIRAVGDEAADGWREAMVVTSLSRMGREVPASAMKFSDADRERLYYHAWSYMSPAEWAGGYLAVRGTFTDAEWSVFWQPYRSVLGEPPPT